MRPVLLLVATVCLVVSTGKAQDPVKVDPKHNKVEFENDQVRVLRTHVTPKESIPMHEHPANVVVWLTDARNKASAAKASARKPSSYSRQDGFGGRALTMGWGRERRRLTSSLRKEKKAVA